MLFYCHFWCIENSNYVQQIYNLIVDHSTIWYIYIYISLTFVTSFTVGQLKYYTYYLYIIYYKYLNINVILCIKLLQLFFILDSTVTDIDIIRCLLYCVQGVNSNLITFNENENHFNIIANVSYFILFF